ISDMFESPTMTCRRRYRSASACGSSPVLMIERGEVGAPAVSSARCFGRRAGDFLADVLRALRQAVVEAARRLQHLARARENLPGDEEGNERLGQALERHVARDQVVLVAAVGIAGRVGVVLEEQDVAGDPVLPQPLLGLV